MYNLRCERFDHTESCSSSFILFNNRPRSGHHYIAELLNFVIIVNGITRWVIRINMYVYQIFSFNLRCSVMALLSCSNLIGWSRCLAGTSWTVNLDLHILTFSVVKIPSASEHSLPDHSDHELLPDPDVPHGGPEHAGDVLPADGDAAVHDGAQRCLNHPWTRVLCLQVFLDINSIYG